MLLTQKIPQNLSVSSSFSPMRKTNDFLRPFGVGLKNRDFSSEKYRYGFQNQERDDEMKGEGNSINFTYRMHDPRLGRFLSIDPLFLDYPHISPYVFCENSVTAFIDLEGLEKYSVHTYSFAPSNYFGTIFDACGFEGDGDYIKFGDKVRPTVWGNENFRIGAKVTLDLSTEEVISEEAYGSGSQHSSGAWATSEANWEQTPSFFLNTLSFEVSGNNDAFLWGATPYIDLEVDVSLSFDA